MELMRCFDAAVLTATVAQLKAGGMNKARTWP
jgi:hypothetical protein